MQLEVKQKVLNVVTDAEMKWLNENNVDDYLMFEGCYTDSTNYQPTTHPSKTPTSNVAISGVTEDKQ